MLLQLERFVEEDVEEGSKRRFLRAFCDMEGCLAHTQIHNHVYRKIAHTWWYSLAVTNKFIYTAVDFINIKHSFVLSSMAFF